MLSLHFYLTFFGIILNFKNISDSHASKNILNYAIRIYFTLPEIPKFTKHIFRIFASFLPKKGHFWSIFVDLFKNIFI